MITFLKSTLLWSSESHFMLSYQELAFDSLTSLCNFFTSTLKFEKMSMILTHLLSNISIPETCF